MQCNTLDLNKVYLSAVWQELVPKSGIDGSYRCSISPYLRPISFGPPPYHLFSSLSSGPLVRPVLWCTAGSVFVSKTAKILESSFPLLGLERVMWHFRSHCPYDIWYPRIRCKISNLCISGDRLFQYSWKESGEFDVAMLVQTGPIWPPPYQLKDMKSVFSGNLWISQLKIVYTSYRLISIVRGLVLSGPIRGVRCLSRNSILLQPRAPPSYLKRLNYLLKFKGDRSRLF